MYHMNIFVDPGSTFQSPKLKKFGWLKKGFWARGF